MCLFLLPSASVYSTSVGACFTCSVTDVKWFLEILHSQKFCSGERCELFEQLEKMFELLAMQSGMG